MTRNFEEWEERLEIGTALNDVDEMYLDWKAEREKYFVREKWLVDMLECLEVWANSFEDIPPKQMKDIELYSTTQTAGDYRQLHYALEQARAVLEGVRG